MSTTRQESSDKARIKTLLTRAGDSWCALPLARVRRVIRALKLYPLPGAGEVVAGLAEVDGEPLVILSLERLLDAPAGASAEFPVTLLVESGAPGSAEVVGLAADEAGDIVVLDSAQIVGPPRGIVQGETQTDHGPVRFLDLSRMGTPS